MTADILGRLGLGLALFLYGMSFLGHGLQTALGGALKRWLGRAAATLPRGFFLGAAVTAVVQSSSAATVMVVGLADAGVLTLRQAAAVIAGANVGTTVTAWLLALNMGGGLAPLLPLLAAAGIALWVWGRSDAVRGGGMVALGAAALFLGLEQMTAALGGLPTGGLWPAMLRTPWRGLLLGAAVTAVVQSSSASVGMLQALTATGAVSLGAALPVVLGENVGTCATALLSALPSGKTGRRAALWHLLFNAGGAALCFLLFLAVRRWPVFSEAATPLCVAALHTVFNLTAAAVSLPLLSRYGAGQPPAPRAHTPSRAGPGEI